MGPLSEDTLSARFACWLPAWRFGIGQGSKLRAIDDFSEGGVNDTLDAHETVAPSDLGAIASGVRVHLAAILAEQGPLWAEMRDETASRHADFDEAILLGRLWDQSKAYRQLARSPSHSSLTIIAV